MHATIRGYEGVDTALPNAPRITSGKVIAQHDGGGVA